MVDSVSSWASRSFLQTQNQASGQAAQSQRAAAKPAQTIIDQIGQTIEQGKSLMKQPASTGSVGAPTLTANANLPRGSLIDIVV